MRFRWKAIAPCSDRCDIFDGIGCIQSHTQAANYVLRRHVSFVHLKTTCYMHHCDAVAALQMTIKNYERRLEVEDLELRPLLLMTMALKS